MNHLPTDGEHICGSFSCAFTVKSMRVTGGSDAGAEHRGIYKRDAQIEQCLAT